MLWQAGHSGPWQTKLRSLAEPLQARFVLFVSCSPFRALLRFCGIQIDQSWTRQDLWLMPPSGTLYLLSVRADNNQHPTRN